MGMMLLAADERGLRLISFASGKRPERPQSAWHKDSAPFAETIRQLNAWIKEYARTEHLVYVDYYSAMVDDQGGIRPDLSMDKAVHPNDAGYAIMQPLAERGIESALALPQP